MSADLPPGLQKASTAASPRRDIDLAAVLERFRLPPSIAARADAIRSLAVMVSARLPLVDALETASEQATHRGLTGALQDVAAHVRGGGMLSSGFAQHVDIFGPLATGLVKVGEASSHLDTVLLRTSESLERSAELRRRIRYALAYPAVVLIVAGAAVSFLLAVVVPTFASLFADFDAPLPWPTRVLISASALLRTAGPFLVLALVAAYYLGRRALQGEPTRRWVEAVTLSIPVIGRVYREMLTARFCRTLSTLLQGGVPLADALAVNTDAEPSPRASDASRALRARVIQGGTLAGPLGREVDLFPPMVAQMISVGEATARLGETLDYAAAHYERQVEGATDALSSVLEPVLVLVLGLIVGAILIAIYLPMFDLVTTVQ